ncbi:dus [Symbiodinium microadriaticum]|nr:dus [Symbiodinium microadriaticum]
MTLPSAFVPNSTTMALRPFRAPPGLAHPGYALSEASSPSSSESSPAFRTWPKDGGQQLPAGHVADFTIEWFGSYGHPEVCNRPCVYLLKEGGGCPDGAGCQYCHLPHHRTGAKPDKRQREVLQTMSDQERLFQFLPHIRRRAAKMGSPWADYIAQLLEDEMKEPHLPLVRSFELKQVLKKMTFAQLVLSSMNNVPAEAKHALTALRLQLPAPEVVNRGPYCSHEPASLSGPPEKAVSAAIRAERLLFQQHGEVATMLRDLGATPPAADASALEEMRFSKRFLFLLLLYGATGPGQEIDTSEADFPDTEAVKTDLHIPRAMEPASLGLLGAARGSGRSSTFCQRRGGVSRITGRPRPIRAGSALDARRSLVAGAAGIVFKRAVRLRGRIGRKQAQAADTKVDLLQERWQLGRWRLRGRTVLAPMEQVTDCAFRRLCYEIGASFTWTEMVRAAALLRRNNSTTSRMDTFDSSTPTGVQLLVSSPEELSEALQLIEDRAASDKPHWATGIHGIDLNFGCPSPHIINDGLGPAMLNRPFVLREMFERLAEWRSQTSLPIGAIGAKMRLGLNEDEERREVYLRAIRYAKGRLDYVVLHPRNAREESKKSPARWEHIRKAKELAGTRLSIIGNGDVFSRSDADRMLRETGCDAVMIARGATKTVGTIFDPEWDDKAAWPPYWGKSKEQPTAVHLEPMPSDSLCRTFKNRILSTGPLTLYYHLQLA